MQSLDEFYQNVEAQNKAGSASTNPLLGWQSTDLTDAPTTDIVEALRTLRMSAQLGTFTKTTNKYKRIISLVKYLVVHRKHPLDSFIYESIMDTMADPRGSALGVRKLLEDMYTQNVSPTASICYSALEALAVHPDYVLRQKVINTMHEYWFEFTPSAKQNIAVGLLRDGQYELALDKLDELTLDKHTGLSGSEARVELWVYDIFILEFGRMGFYDEMLELLNRRKRCKGTDSAFRSIQLIALDVFSRAFHLEGTNTLWADVVKTGIHRPSTSIIENVMATGARHGDTSLATGALDILSQGGKLAHEHHEAVIDAFAHAGDVENAFHTMVVVDSSGWNVTRGGSRAIYRALVNNPESIDKAVSVLSKIHQNGPVPSEAVMVTIEAMIHVRGPEAAMPLYRDIYFLTGKQGRYSILRQLIEQSTNVDTIYQLAKDYNALVVTKRRSVSENAPVYEAMIPACVKMQDSDLAWELVNSAMTIAVKGRRSSAGSYEAKLEDKTWHTHKWVEGYLNFALEAKDARVWQIIGELEKGDSSTVEMVRRVLIRHSKEQTVKQTDTTADGEQTGPKGADQG
ncbi:hypothetical protein F66182_2137 [Fusarium sp. NRRL 66182]|nr:hypothetical protein F66182_2137 [Fusarium sp. NRRL 66182]